MTNPTITYGHGWLTDCDNTTGPLGVWDENVNNMLVGDATLTCEDGDIFQIQADFDEYDGGVTDEYCYYEYPDSGGANNLAISPTLYPYITFRFKTSESSAGAHARIELVYSAGGPYVQTVLASGYSTIWTVPTAVPLATGVGNVDHIRFYADDDAETPDDTYYVYYDFALIHRNTFTIPKPDHVSIRFPMKIARISIPGRDGDILQRLGLKSPEITLSGEMLFGGEWSDGGVPDATGVEDIYGYPLLWLLRKDPWNWLTIDGKFGYKVMVAEDGLFMDYDASSPSYRLWHLNLLGYGLSSMDLSTWGDYEWLGHEP